MFSEVQSLAEKTKNAVVVVWWPGGQMGWLASLGTIEIVGEKGNFWEVWGQGRELLSSCNLDVKIIMTSHDHPQLQVYEICATLLG